METERTRSLPEIRHPQSDPDGRKPPPAAAGGGCAGTIKNRPGYYGSLHNSHPRFFFLTDLTISLTSFSSYPTDFAHFCASSSEASNSTTERSFKVLSMITSPEVYATSLSPVSMDREKLDLPKEIVKIHL